MQVDAILSWNYETGLLSLGDVYLDIVKRENAILLKLSEAILNDLPKLETAVELISEVGVLFFALLAEKRILYLEKFKVQEVKKIL